jgi:hypothetical protein
MKLAQVMAERVGAKNQIKINNVFRGEKIVLSSNEQSKAHQMKNIIKKQANK